MIGGAVVESALELADRDNDGIVSVILEHDLNRSILCCVPLCELLLLLQFEWLLLHTLIMPSSPTDANSPPPDDMLRLQME
jgi:hypothetical protein